MSTVDGPVPLAHVTELLPEHDRPHWMRYARCRYRDTNEFFPTRGEGTASKVFCGECPVVDECLEYALEHRIIHGIWGGKSERERRRIRARRRERTLP